MSYPHVNTYFSDIVLRQLVVADLYDQHAERADVLSLLKLGHLGLARSSNALKNLAADTIPGRIRRLFLASPILGV